MKQFAMKNLLILAVKSDPLNISSEFTGFKLRVHSRCSVPEDSMHYVNVPLSPLQEPKAAKPDSPVRGQIVFS